MKKTHSSWSVSKLARLATKISYPEYQRESNVWDRQAKQRLIDSIIRGFDIASIYFYVPEMPDDTDDIPCFECIDGRQRINALLSFLGINEDKLVEKDLNFKIRITNEVDPDTADEALHMLNELSYADLENSDYPFGLEYKQKIDNHEINVVIITEINTDINELNLLFERLQFGKTLNAGEKLHAMAGDMKDSIFNTTSGITLHKFFQQLEIPKWRYSREQVAAQIVYNHFSKYEDPGRATQPPGTRGIYARSRYYDLQLFFKDKMVFSETDNQHIQNIREYLDTIYDAFGENISHIKNRALAVSIYLFGVWLIKQEQEDKLNEFSEFIVKLIRRVNWQVKKLSKMRQSDAEYRGLFTFQSYINQAAVEEYAIAGRERYLHELFRHYLENNGEIEGDRAFYSRTGNQPDSSPLE
ncbi:MAG: DUF262 domain-containing protein [Dehalogenimonas sp.]